VVNDRESSICVNDSTDGWLTKVTDDCGLSCKSLTEQIG
jgi:hypothetical protein